MDATSQPSSEASGRRPSLLPSPFPDVEALSPRAEGYEGEKLHDLFFSSQSQHQVQQGPVNPRPLATPATVDLGVEGSHDIAQNPSQQLKPFFTVIEDASTGEYHHPHVHYIFSDDDPALLTDALLDILQPASDLEDRPSIDASRQSTHECMMVVDLADDGRTIISARSLTPTWHTLEHSVTLAPTFSQDSGPAEGTMMLRISGRDVSSSGSLRKSQQSKHTRDEGPVVNVIEPIQELVSQYEEEMAVLMRAAQQDEPVAQLADGPKM